jgi:hypothetical protein
MSQERKEKYGRNKFTKWNRDGGGERWRRRRGRRESTPVCMETNDPQMEMDELSRRPVMM